MILPDPFPAFNSSQDDIHEITPERNEERVLEPEKKWVLELEKEKMRNPEKVLEPEKEKPARVRSMSLRSSAPGLSRKKKETRKRRVRTP